MSTFRDLGLPINAPPVVDEATPELAPEVQAIVTAACQWADQRPYCMCAADLSLLQAVAKFREAKRAKKST
ncbi:MAG TPA: hypothetical protein VFQ61_06475 [Polyangiaceae bacterium]|nr:hypothetical protein [Polyangiaceae bacterium]